jgi:hypothetical protein
MIFSRKRNQLLKSTDNDYSIMEETQRRDSSPLLSLLFFKKKELYADNNFLAPSTRLHNSINVISEKFDSDIPNFFASRFLFSPSPSINVLMFSVQIADCNCITMSKGKKKSEG